MANLTLTNNPEEFFSVSINSAIYNFRQLWNTSGFWTLDIRDADDVAIVLGVKIVAQILLLYQYPQIRFDLLSDADADPGRFDLDEFVLEIVDKDV